MTTSTSSAARPYRGSASMATLALLSEKGGAGKSLAAEGLLAVGAARGLRALAVDLDGRATLTRTLTNVPLLPRSTPSIGDVLDPAEEDVPKFDEVVLEIRDRQWNVDLVPARRTLSTVARSMDRDGSDRLRDLLDEARPHYDLVVIDTAGEVSGPTVFTALRAATDALVLCPPESGGEEGAAGSVSAVRRMQEERRELNLVGVALTHWQGTITNVMAQVEANFAALADDLLVNVRVPSSLSVAFEARREGVPITAALPRSRRLVDAYEQLLDLILRR